MMFKMNLQTNCVFYEDYDDVSDYDDQGAGGQSLGGGWSQGGRQWSKYDQEIGFKHTAAGICQDQILCLTCQ